MRSLQNRQRQAEWMDEPHVELRRLEQSLRFIRRVNATLRYTQATISHLERFSKSWKSSEKISLLDVATGSADIPRAIASWAVRKNFNVAITGLDRHAMTARIALSLSRREHIPIVRGDAMQLPFADGAFDYVMSNMFLHHLDDDAIVSVLREMNRVARRGILWGDLVRNRRAHFWSRAMTYLSDPIVRHDAVVSVEQAFTREEVIALAHRAGLDYANYQSHFGHRFVLAGEKTTK